LVKINNQRIKSTNSPPIDEVLSSRGRVKILKLLAEKGEINISAISKQVKLNHGVVVNHLEYLVRIGLVKEKTFGRIRIFQYQDQNIRAHSLKQLFNIWDNTV